MTNRPHLEILQQGQTAWNMWRKINRKIHPNLKGANLMGANLAGFDLNSCNLSKADISNANLSNTDLSKTNLVGANLSGTNLSNANLVGADMENAKLIGANMSDATLSYFDEIDTTYFASLRNSILTNINLSNAKLAECDLSGANLSGANLIGADLSSADLSNTKLTKANLSETNIGGTNLSNANLGGADLFNARIISANFNNTNFKEARMGGTIIDNTDLRKAKELETVKHLGGSTIGINTIYKSHGAISETFLRQAGLPETFLDYMYAIIEATSPIEYYTCFISYSSKNQDFAERLYADLQSRGVRCWFAPKNLKPGDYYRYKIDESIKMYDKLLLILSKDSIQSTWVKHEVEKAYKKEEQMDMARQVLFPIRLDDTVIQTTRSWAATLRHLRHIGDFTNWKQHDAYQEAFQQLLEDLKAQDENQKQQEA